MVENKNVPEIRLKEFTKKWEMRQLGEIVSFSKGRGYSKSDLTDAGTPIILYGRMYTNYQTVISEVNSYTKPKINSVFSKGNEVIIPSSGESAEDIARASVIGNPNILIGGDLNVLLPTNDIDSVFLAYNISNGNPKIELGKKAQGKTVVHLHNSDLHDILISYPKILEQSQIGTFFQNFDSLITLHQRKYIKLTTVKNAMLEKMFPKDGAGVPEIRFKGFTGPWEEIKLKDIASKVTEKNASKEYAETLTNSAEFGIISQRDYFDKDISNSENIGGYYVVRPGDFVYNPRISTFAPVGPVNLNKLGRTGIMSPLYTVFRTMEIDNIFLDYFFKTECWHPFMFYNGDTGARADRFSIKDSVFLELPIPYPSVQEQQKIGTYFRHLDTLITLQQRELEKLKNIKKACLEKMFV